MSQGERIGAVGATGRATGPHLDWRMNWYDRRIDPALVLSILRPESREIKIMPELPEVETVRQGLRDVVEGAVFKNVAQNRLTCVRLSRKPAAKA